MRWRKNYRRVVKRFAIFPVKALVKEEDVPEYCWLETVYLVQNRDCLFGVFPIWKAYAFITKHDYDSYIERNKPKQETKAENEPI